MRRSAAPSQLASACKRPRFTPPFAVKQTSGNEDTLEIKNQRLSTSNRCYDAQKPIDDRSALNVLQPHNQTREPFGQTLGSSAFTSPMKQTLNARQSPASNVEEDSAEIRNSTNDLSGCTDNKLCSNSNDENSVQPHEGSKVKQGHLISGSLGDSASAREQAQAPDVKARPRSIQYRGFRQPSLQTTHPPKAVAVHEQGEPEPHYFNVVWYVCFIRPGVSQRAWPLLAWSRPWCPFKSFPQTLRFSNGSAISKMKMAFPSEIR